MRAYRLPVRGRIKAIGECALHTMTEPLIQQSGRPVPTGAKVFERHALRTLRWKCVHNRRARTRKGHAASVRLVPRQRLRRPLGAPLWKSVRDSAHITYSLFTVHHSLKNMNCLRSRHISHSPLVLSHEAACGSLWADRVVRPYREVRQLFVGRDDPGAPLWKSVRGSAHITYSLFTIHHSLKNMNCLRSRHNSHSPLALSP